ncbi:Acetyl esterase/lipase [Duganella sp. CF402]|uniref:alpha/beta hydrolase n=1 Tax=unclassified Duganella TaxID=2636909 RepID=UPI0008ABECD7|nr:MULTISPECIES: alpha/beta hydrolase [unclassified Duganella]RZT08198.1 acetyl esterase/lipase [Duganella sp. BK701]SEM02451.1 Acetyl esterase/lipase [Duganella sp. CF402]
MLRNVLGLALPFALFALAPRASAAPLCNRPAIDLPAPSATDSTVETSAVDGGTLIIRNVTRPTLTAILPPSDKSTGAAVIIAPGGGFLSLFIDKEGCQIGEWLAERGIAAFILKYRLNPTPASHEQFKVELLSLMKGGKASFSRSLDTTPDALADGLAALRHVRQQAGDYKVDSSRVGFMGFSAGGYLTRSMVSKGGADVPAFAAPIYSKMGPLVVPDNAPPMFVAIGQKDFLLEGVEGFPLIDNYRKAGKPIEFHFFSDDEHGFGAGAKGKTSEGWLKLFYQWLEMGGFLAKAGVQ